MNLTHKLYVVHFRAAYECVQCHVISGMIYRMSTASPLFSSVKVRSWVPRAARHAPHCQYWFG